jgi:pyruvate dehydrogenase E1 component alpha subunit
MWKQKDPIPRFEAYLIQEGLLTQPEVETIAEEAFQLIEEAVAFAESSPEPRVEEITEGVYA